MFSLKLTNPFLSPKASVASLIVSLASLGTVGLTFIPVLQAMPGLDPAVVHEIDALLVFLAGLSAIHLSVSRSIASGVDNTKTVEAPGDSVVTVDVAPNAPASAPVVAAPLPVQDSPAPKPVKTPVLDPIKPLKDPEVY